MNPCCVTYHDNKWLVVKEVYIAPLGNIMSYSNKWFVEVIFEALLGDVMCCSNKWLVVEIYMALLLGHHELQ